MDLISRQAAIDAVCKAGCGSGYCGISCDDVKAIEQLPSAQPEPCGDVVSRNAIIQKLNTMDRYVSTELRLCDTDKKFPQNEVFIVDDVYEEIVEQLPSAQPEIIRCKDCNYWSRESICDGFCSEDCMRHDEDFYCGYAERRTDGV